MRILLSLFAFIILISSAIGQIISFADPNLKRALLEHDPIIDLDNDGEIDQEEAKDVNQLLLQDKGIISLEGIQYFTSILKLDCNKNNIEEIDLSQFINLIELDCSRNNLKELNLAKNISLERLSCMVNRLSDLDVSNNMNLVYLKCLSNPLYELDITSNTKLEELESNANRLSELDVTQNPNLQHLQCVSNQIKSLDLSKNLSLQSLQCIGNPIPRLDLSNNLSLTTLSVDVDELKTLIFPNPHPVLLDWLYFRLDSESSLEYICADEKDFPFIYAKLEASNVTDVIVNSYCPYTYELRPYTVKGRFYVDQDNNGCTEFDDVLVNRRLNIFDGNRSGFFISDNSGEYLIQLNEGSYTIAPNIIATELFSSDPESITINLPSTQNPVIQDFCITPIGEKDDLEVTIVPIDRARPGFEANYKIVYQNNGNTILSGDIEFSFLGEVVKLESTTVDPITQTINSLSWTFDELAPFAKGEIMLTMRLNTPTADPALNDGDVLKFIAYISVEDSEDLTPDNNRFELKQTVVNSFDPNDKTCLEGESLLPEMIGEYVHYLIRFENKGSAEAVNIKVADEIDSNKYDISSVEVIDASHNFDVSIVGNLIEFLFRDINLPFDDDNNDGFIAFKIKTLPTLAIGDDFANDADIYFDYNVPILTNEYVTTVEMATATKNQSQSDPKITFFPNPSKDQIYIESKLQIIRLELLDIQGKKMRALDGTTKRLALDIRDLESGIYLIKVLTKKGWSIEKIVVE